MNGVNYLLIVVLTTIAFGMIKGYRKGFLRLAVYLAGLIMVILLVTKISPYVSDFLINNTDVYTDVKDKIIDMYLNQTGNESAFSQNNEVETIQGFGLPEIISTALITNNTEDMYTKLAVALFEEYIAGYLAKLVIKAGSFVGLFIILVIGMFCLFTAIKIIEKIPVLRTFNRCLGMIAGAGMVIVFVWVFFIAIMIFFGDSLGSWMLTQVKSSIFLSFLFNNNYLFQMLL